MSMGYYDSDNNTNKNITESDNYYGASRLREHGLNPNNFRYAGYGYYENKGIGSDAWFDDDGTIHRSM